MGSLSDYAENRLLNHVFNSSQAVGSTVYLALYTVAPTDSTAGTEVTNANNYSRQAITFGAPSARRITQNAQVDYPTASGAWGTVVAWAVTDSATHAGGNVLAYGDFSASFSPVNGNTPRIATGQVYIEIGAGSGQGLTTYLVHALLNHMFRATAFSSTAGNTFLALLNAVCSDAATTMAGQTECSGTSYARREVNENGGASPAWTVASGGALSNGAAATFATPGAGGWSQLVAVAVVDASSGTSANVLVYDNTNVVDQTPASGDTVEFATGDFDVSLS